MPRRSVLANRRVGKGAERAVPTHFVDNSAWARPFGPLPTYGSPFSRAQTRVAACAQAIPHHHGESVGRITSAAARRTGHCRPQ